MTTDRSPGRSVDRPAGFDPDYPRLLLGGLAVAVLVGVLLAGTTSASAFGLFNPGWEGVSDLRGVADGAGAETEVAANAGRYGTVAPERTVAVVLSPERAYADHETAEIRAFVRAGGTLVVAEDFGPHADPLLDAVGAGTRFDGTLLRDERSEWRSPAMPVATEVTNRSETPYTERVSALTLNYGTALEPGPNATVLVRSSPFSYLDANGNGRPDGDETLASYPVVAVEPVGDGRIVAVSDASVFLNAMLERDGNRRFARNLLGSRERVLLDASHSTLPPLSAALVAVRSSPVLGFGLGVAVLSLVGAWGAGSTGRLRGVLAALLPGTDRRGTDSEGADRRGGGRPVSPGVDVDALTAYVRRRHPDWDEDRVRRVAQGVLPDGDERRQDE